MYNTKVFSFRKTSKMNCKFLIFLQCIKGVFGGSTLETQMGAYTFFANVV